MGKTPSRDNSNYWNGSNAWVSIADIKEKYIDTTKEGITDKAVNECGIYRVPQGTVIMSFKLTVGRAAIAKCDLFTNEAIMAFSPKQNGILLPDYIYYYLKKYKWIGANKAVMGKTLNKKSISENIFAYPPLPIQKQIVSELDKVSEIIEKKKQQVKELDTLAQSIFYDMFGDPVENEKGWEKISVKDASVKITDGSHNPPKGIDYSEYRMISSQNITDNGIVLQNIRYLTKEDFENENKRTNLQSGDVLLTIVGTIGRTCVLQDCDGVFTLQRSVAVIRPTDNINSIFLQHQFIQCRCELEKEAHGIAQKGIYLKQLAAFHIILPPLSLQQAFAEKVEAIEKQKELITASLKEAERLFDSRMEYWFGE